MVLNTQTYTYRSYKEMDVMELTYSEQNKLIKGKGEGCTGVEREDVMGVFNVIGCS